MKNIITILLFSVFVFASAQSIEEIYFLSAESIIPWNGKIPQAPRVSPDGGKLLYELYGNGNCEIMMCNSDGSDCKQLTNGVIDRVENAFWHPSMKYITFNRLPEGNIRNGEVYVAEIINGKLGKMVEIDKGARAQFSRPNGNVLFFESTVDKNNTIKYRILGHNPVDPVENNSIELRGPIQEISKNEELSHPSLAPDGTTILFAARTSTSGEFLNNLNINDGNRQKAVSLWSVLVNTNKRYPYPIDSLQSKLDEYLNTASTDFSYKIERPFIYKDSEIEVERIKGIINNAGNKPFFIDGYTQKDFLIAWLLGLFEKYDKAYEHMVMSTIYSRLWITNVFGANIVPLVPDEASVPLPQKWSTVSSSGNYAIFEAGHYNNRHIYLISLQTKKVIKLTSEGTYNSSPEISPDEKWLYFESNRSGKKEIWRAQLNTFAIRKMTR